MKIRTQAKPPLGKAKDQVVIGFSFVSDYLADIISWANQRSIKRTQCNSGLQSVELTGIYNPLGTSGSSHTCGSRKHVRQS